MKKWLEPSTNRVVRDLKQSKKVLIGCSLSVGFLLRKSEGSLWQGCPWFQFLNLEVFIGLALVFLHGLPRH